MTRTPFSNIPQWAQWFQRKWNIICTMVIKSTLPNCVESTDSACSLWSGPALLAIKGLQQMDCEKKKVTINHIIIYYNFALDHSHIKFQCNSSNSSWDILLTRFHCNFFQRGITQERGIAMIRKKKYGSTIFSCGLHMWNFKNLAWVVQKLYYAQKSVTNGWKNEQTNGQAQTNMPYQLLWSWGHNKSILLYVDVSRNCWVWTVC